MTTNEKNELISRLQSATGLTPEAVAEAFADNYNYKEEGGEA